MLNHYKALSVLRPKHAYVYVRVMIEDVRAIFHILYACGLWLTV